MCTANAAAAALLHLPYLGQTINSIECPLFSFNIPKLSCSQFLGRFVSKCCFF